MSAGAHGPFRSALVGPKSPTTGVPTAAARCSGPVSPEIITRAPLAIPNTSLLVVGGATSAAPPAAAATDAASDSSRGPHSTSDRRPCDTARAAATAPKRAGGQRLFGHAAPGLTARTRQHRTAARTCSTTCVTGTAIGNVGRSSAHAEGRKQPEVLEHDVCVAARLRCVRVEEPRRRFAEIGPWKADRAPRAHGACHHRRLDQPLEVDHRGVLDLAKGEKCGHQRQRVSPWIGRNHRVDALTCSSSSTYLGSTSQSIRADGKRSRSAAATGIP